MKMVVLKGSDAKLIQEEMKRAKDKFPWWPADRIHAAAIVAEEAGELLQATLQARYENGSFERIRKEAIQTATMAIRFLENLPGLSPHGYEPPAAEVCIWQEDEEDGWKTSCGEIFDLDNSTPVDDDMRFCCFCGKRLEQKRVPEANDADIA